MFVSCKDEHTHFDDKESIHIDSIINAASVTSNGDIPKAIKFIDSAISGKNLTVEERFKVYGFKCDIFHNRTNDPKKASLYADSMMYVVEQHKEKYNQEYALANYSKGDVLFKAGNYDEAYTHYYQARLAGKTDLDSCTLGEYSFRLGMILYKQSRYKEAAENFKQSFAESSTCGIDFGRFYRLQQLLNNTGLGYFQAGMLDSALFYYQKALQFIDSRAPFSPQLNDVAKAVVNGNLASIYIARDDLATAKSLLISSIEVNSQKGYDNTDAQFSLLKLADVYYLENKIDSMAVILQQAQASIYQLQNREAEMRMNRMLWKYYNRISDATKAYEHLTRFTAMSDSAEMESNKLKSTDLSRQIKMLEDRYSIEELKKRNQIKNLTLVIFFITVILGSIIVAIILQNLKRSKLNLYAQKQLNEQINVQKEQLEQMLLTLEEKNHEQQRILRVVAHDLRTPIAAISMLTDILLRDKDESTRIEMTELIKTSANNSLNLISEILEATSGEETALAKAPVDINQLVHDCAEVLKFKAAEKEQVISLHLLPEKKMVSINEEKIWRVITNLITNAIKFSTIGAEINIRVIDAANKVTIAVIDQGIGIPETLQPRVFDMFTQAKRKGTAGEKPYGLGLSICKHIVEAHEGKIWFESIEGKGTSFFIELG